MGASIDILLFVIWHVPELPSLKDIAIGTNESLVIEAHEPKVIDAPIIKDRFTMILSSLIAVGTLLCWSFNYVNCAF